MEKVVRESRLSYDNHFGVVVVIVMNMITMIIN